MNLSYIHSFKSRHYKWLAFLSGALSIFGTAVDRGSSNVIIPEIAEHFSADIPTVQWVLISYLVVVAAIMLPVGRLADIIGRKIVIISGLLIFTIGGIISASASEMIFLFGGRILQGFGGAMIQGTSMTIAVDAFGQNQRGRSIGLILIFVGMGNIAGPAIGGFITGLFGWQAVFIVTSLITLSSAILAFIVLRSDSNRNNTGAFDWVGSFFFTNFLIALLAGFTMVPSFCWNSPYTLPVLAFSILLLVGFIRRSTRFEDPVLNLNLFLKPLFSASIAANFLCFIGMSSAWFLLPFYLKYVMFYTPQQIGMVFMPAAAGMAIASPISGRLSDRFGWRPFTIGGLLLATSGLMILSFLDENSPRWLPILGVLPISTGMGSFYGPNNSATLSVSDDKSYGAVIAFINLIRNSGNLMSVPVSTLIVTSVMGSLGHPPDLSAVTENAPIGLIPSFISGMSTSFISLTVMVGFGMLLSLYKGKAKTL